MLLWRESQVANISLFYLDVLLSEIMKIDVRLIFFLFQSKSFMYNILRLTENDNDLRETCSGCQLTCMRDATGYSM